MPPINTIPELFSVTGLVAVITGGGSGIGLYAARALDANGAKAVYIVGRREQTLLDAAKTGVNGTIKPIVGDVADKASLQKVVEQVKAEQGYVNFLFCNAGISGPRVKDYLHPAGDKPTIQELQKALWEPSLEDFTSAAHINNTAVFYTVVAFLDLLDAANKKRNVPQDAQVVVTTSIAGFSRSLAAGFSYSTSKAAANHLVKLLSTNFAQNGFHIRVNLLAPGLYPSEMTAKQTKQLQGFKGVEGHQGAFENAHVMAPEASPAERTGSEQDIAGTILYLASPAGAYLNGETLVSDGGRLAQLPSVY